MNEIRNGMYAFVIMPFSSKLDHTYKDLIRPAVTSCGIDCIRADEESQGHIHSQMLQRIFEAPVIIADITELNANVFYELGIAHSIGCKTVIICSSDFIQKVPFDIAPYRVFVYQESDSSNQYENIQTLALEIENVLKNQPEGIPNPVQDYLLSQSPVHSTTSIFINKLDSHSEEELIKNARNEIVFYGITANSFSDFFTGISETRDYHEEFNVRLCLLNPKVEDSWDFLYKILQKETGEPSLIEQRRKDDIQAQERAIRRLTYQVNNSQNLTISINYYDTPPIFWAYLVDQERLILGHLAMQRQSSRNFPVNIIIKDDLATKNLFVYYQALINSLIS